MTSNPIYHAPAPELEARSRLTSLLSVCEHELASLEELGDARLAEIIDRMREFHQELLAALAAIAPDPAPA
jgi:hypothetical protein